MNCVQQTLDFTPEIPFTELTDKKKYSSISVHFSSRMKKGWHVKIWPYSERRVLTIPRFLENAPLYIKTNLLEWSLLPRKSRRKEIKERRRVLEKSVWNYLFNRGFSDIVRINKKLCDLKFKTAGTRYDLKDVFCDINRQYFQAKINSFIRWGSYASRTSYQSKKYDSEGRPFNLITIAGVYNHPQTPLFALKAVVYHETLHIKYPPYKKTGRNVIHGPEFKRVEKLYPDYKRWREWEKKSFFRNYRDLKRHKRKYDI